MSGDDFLKIMAHASHVRVQVARSRLPEAALLTQARATAAPPALLHAAGGFDLIAEMKLRSPAVGQLRAAADEDPARRALTYAEAGAAAVSVLTEPSRFDGSLEHLVAASAALRTHQVPAMRKDFLVDPYQVLEARAAGAGGVLIILRMLSRSQLAELCATARDCGLFALLEAFDEADIELAHAMLEAELAGAQGPPVQWLVGVNCRDLSTLQVVPGRLEALAPLLPTGVPRVAESGVGSAADAARVAAAGYDLALVGSALMSGADPRTLAQAMVSAGRRSRQQAT
ncbi:MAG TPA: indole-3-glycerol-phosphate synthase [Steroidobacteraceae bacterium]|nr:indole-3-glycerol-phosphate synthase [Steroidobacteraceae bacterium]